MTQRAFALGFGIGTQDAKRNWLEVFYPKPLTQVDDALASLLKTQLHFDGATALLTPKTAADLADKLTQENFPTEASQCRDLAESCKPTVVCLLQEDSKIGSTPEAYLKLQLISHRLAKPQQLNLEGLFAVLPNVAWTNQGAIALDELAEQQLKARCSGKVLSVESVDKFPKMTDYVVPTGVRIADTARVRLGAYIGEGTTIMHEGFVNFNAGTMGASMVEGRISAGVIVGKDSDLGGGCSTMGTLSGGNNIIISIGEQCLLGANAGCGIPLGDRCTIEAGLYLTAGAKVNVLDQQGNLVETKKARDLAATNDLLFRRNSVSGAIECLTNKTAIQLNEMLHAHN